MKAVLSETKNVSFPGVKATMLFKHGEQKECDGALFVRLNPNAPKPRPTSASCLKALADMMHIRNESQAELLKPADGCSLFSTVAQKNLKASLEWLMLRRRRKEQMLLP